VTQEIEIAGRRIGPGHPCFVIAEAGVNHNGDLALARGLIDAAVAAGADAVKFQTFSAEELVTETAPKADYQQRVLGTSGTQFDMLKQLELSCDDHFALAAYAREKGILFLSTPFDRDSVELLEKMNIAAYKISSGDVTNHPLLAQIARKGRPMIVSTGMADLEEVQAAVETIRGAGNPPLALLHCVSCYPADPMTVNLRAMATMAVHFDLPVGFSDHTLDLTIALAATAAGACILEKHLTLDCALPGPDHQASLDPAAFGALMRGVRLIDGALGDGCKKPLPEEANTALVARKSVVVARAVAAGEALAEEVLAIKRPGHGFSPALLPNLVGRVARVSIPAGTVLTPEMLT
jgi:N-acetylneuraminate synthase/N,N'-diacetyllegionaminate synthase